MRLRDGTAVNPITRPGPSRVGGCSGPDGPPPAIDAPPIDSEEVMMPVSEAEMGGLGFGSRLQSAYYEDPVGEVLGPKLIPTTPIMQCEMLWRSMKTIGLCRNTRRCRMLTSISCLLIALVVISFCY